MELTLGVRHMGQSKLWGLQTLNLEWLSMVSSLPQDGCESLHGRSEHNLTSHAICVLVRGNGASPPSPHPRGQKLSCDPPQKAEDCTRSLGTPLLHAAKSIFR